MSEVTPEPAAQGPDEIKKRNRKDYWNGVGLWFLLNIVMWIVFTILGNLISSVQYSPNIPQFLGSILQGLSVLLLFLPFVINIVVMIVLAVRNRKQVAFGMLGGFGISLALVVCAGLVLMAVCFAGTSS